MNVARVLIRTKCALMQIDGVLFIVKVVEDTHNPLRILFPLESGLPSESSKSKFSSDEWLGEEE